MSAVTAHPRETPVDLDEVYRRSTEPVTEEVDVPLTLTEGAVPAGLRGVLFRNGPGRMELYGQPYGHLFDGDGHLNRFEFSDAGVRYRNRYVRTREFLEEEAARKILYRNFGTNIPGGFHKNMLRMRFKNAANTSVVMHAGRLHALWEGGLPHRIDPRSLETLARDDLGGVLRNDARSGASFIDRLLKPELPYSAHPKLDPATGELFNFGVATGRFPTLMLYQLSPEGVCVRREQLVLPMASFVHDYALTANFRVFFLAPTAFDFPRMLLGLASPVDSLRSLPAPTTILVLPRRGTQARSFTARPCFIFHFTNAFEDGPHIIIDAARMDHMPQSGPAARALSGRGAEFPRAHLTRFVLDTRDGSVEERPLTEHSGELATINPAYWTRPHRYSWSIEVPRERRAPYSTGILKVDAETRSSLVRDFAPNLTGEPVFVARPGAAAEDDGWLLSMCYDAEAHAGELLVLDAADLRTVCRARMPHHSPLGFHGTWVPADQLH